VPAGRRAVAAIDHDGHMAVRFDRLWLGVAAGTWVLTMVAGCGSSALTNTAPTNPPAPATNTAPTAGHAVANAVTKLNLISQDGCQTDPPDQVYPVCDRFLAELRSAVNTVRNGSAQLSAGAAVQATSAGILSAADAFDRDGCGGGPYASGPENAATCTGDLGHVRAGLSTLIEQTRGVAGS
jgi:hypothetical protein